MKLTSFYVLNKPTRQVSLNYIMLYKGKYRAESTRLNGHYYTEDGWYFITIYTRDMECAFGKIQNGIMGLSEIGCVVARELYRTEKLRYYVTLDRWIIMPNHIHVIIKIERNAVIDHMHNQFRQQINQTPVVETSRRDVSTTRAMLLFNDVNGRIQKNPPRLRPHSIGSIVGQFKTSCTKQIRKMGHHNFAWQTRFYDRIIWNGDTLNTIRKYIRLNPVKWERDRNNPESLN